MNRYTPQQRAAIVTIYIKNNSSIILTQREFRRRYRNQKAPTAQTIRRLASRFEQSGTTIDARRPGRPRSSRTADNIDLVRESVAENPETSTRRRSAQLKLSRRSLQRILVQDLNLFPYKMQLVHKLQPRDNEKRLEYCNAFLNLVDTNEIFFGKIIMTDEAHFDLSGFVNSQNCRFWGTENPRILHERPLHPLRVTVWCGICAEKVIGPYFFEDTTGNAVTVTGERYRSMIQEFLVPEVEALDQQHMWFQQDGATAHTANVTMEILREIFPGRLISRFGDLAWPPRSPDLTPSDFFLWGHLKERVYINKPKTLQQLKENIQEEIGNLSPEVLKKVMENAIERTRICSNSEGGHLTDVIFHT